MHVPRSLVYQWSNEKCIIPHGPALMEMSSPNVVYQGHNEGGITPQEQGLMDLNPFTTTLEQKNK